MIIVEHIKNGYDHSDGNAAIISLYIKKKKNDFIHLFCGTEHYKIIKQILDKNKLDTSRLVHHDLKIPNNINRDYNLILYDFNIVKTIFDYSHKINDNNILFLYTSTFLLYYLKLFCRINKDINVRTSIHGDLERIDLHDYSQSFDKFRWLQYLYALFFGLKIPLSISAPPQFISFCIFREY